MLSESLVEVTQTLAKATDNHTAVVPGGSYSAQFHALMPKVVVVDTPCGCRVAINSWGEALLTLCMSEACVFDWHEAHMAHKLLMDASAPSKVIEITGVAVKAGEPKDAEDLQALPENTGN
jgi:hypothetical protein